MEIRPIIKTRQAYSGYHQLKKTTLLLSCCVLLSACDNTAIDDSANAGDSSNLILPKALQRASTTIKNNLRAFLTVGNQSPVEMTINDDSMTASVPKPEGETTYRIDIEYQDASSTTPTPILSASKTSSADAVDFTELDFEFIHSDSDSYTNLRELEAGTDPRNADNQPGNDNFETNDTIPTAYDLTAYDGVDLLEPGTLFHNSDLGLDFNYAAAGFLSAQSDIDIFSVNVDESKSRFDVVARFFSFSDRQLGDSDALNTNLSFATFGLRFPDSASGDGFSEFFFTPGNENCEIRSSFNLRYFHCQIFLEFGSQVTHGVVYPYVLMAEEATEFVEYSISWFSTP